jgi:hypothetical protein
MRGFTDERPKESRTGSAFLAIVIPATLILINNSSLVSYIYFPESNMRCLLLLRIQL